MLKLKIINGLILLTSFLLIHIDSELTEEIYRKSIEISISIKSYEKILNQDINVYQDINPDKYSFEATYIYGLATVNLERYYDDGKLKKAKVLFFGDRADLISEYFFWDESLIFVHKSRVHYEKPKWADDFNTTKLTVQEDKYYFNNGKLIQWINFNDEIVDLTKIHSYVERNINSDSKLYSEYEK